MPNLLDELFGEDRTLPNKFTIALGKLIKDARIEAKISQAELAQKAYFKQSSVSRIEAGTRDVSAEEIFYLSIALDKPIIYFFPKELTHEPDENSLTVGQTELLRLARRLSPDDLRKIIAQIRAIIDL